MKKKATIAATEESRNIFSFTDLKNKRKKNFFTSGMEFFKKPQTYVHTGNYTLNALLSGKLLDGGYPEGRIIAIVAPEGTGKTYLCLNSVREFQNVGYCAKYFETEGAVNEELALKFGINTDDEFFDYELIASAEKFRTSITNDLMDLLTEKRAGKEIPKMLFILDSAGNLASEKEIADAISGSEKTDMTRAKILKSIFRIITPLLVEAGATLIFTNHQYDSQVAYAGASASGGCCSPETNVVMFDGSLKLIQDVIIGDYVYTIEGKKKVLATHKLIKDIRMVMFDDGTQLICSDDHLFMDIDNNWLYLDEITPSTKLKNLYHKESHIKSITSLLESDFEKNNNNTINDNVYLCDLTIEDVNYYITENGIINHNSGPKYAASITIFLTKAQLKEGEDKAGIIVSAKTSKNRFVKPCTIKFHIHFTDGMNRYIGLHEYISWENCGIDNGKILTEEQFNKLSSKIQDKSKNDYEKINKTEYKLNNQKYYFINAVLMKKYGVTGVKNFAIKHLATEIEDPNDLFTDKVFTQDVIKQLDESVIKAKFSYGVKDENISEDLFSIDNDVDEIDENTEL